MADVPFVLHIVARWRAEKDAEADARQRREGQVRATTPEVPLPRRRQQHLRELARDTEVWNEKLKQQLAEVTGYCSFFTRVFLSAFKRQNQELFVKVLADSSIHSSLREVAALRFCRVHLFRIYAGLVLPFRLHGTVADGAPFGLPSDVVKQVISYLSLRTLKALSLVSRDLLRSCHAVLACGAAATGSQLLQWVQPQTLVAAADPDYLAPAALVDGARLLAAGARDAMAVACAFVLIQDCGTHLVAPLKLAGDRTPALAVLLTKVTASPTLETFGDCLPQYFEATAPSGWPGAGDDTPTPSPAVDADDAMEDAADDAMEDAEEGGFPRRCGLTPSLSLP